MSIFGFSKKQPKNHITIHAEYKGALSKLKHFSFGNGCKKSNVGYVTMLPARIIAMSISCDKPPDLKDVIVAISIDGNVFQDYNVTINGGEINKIARFNKPLNVRAGTSLNIVSLVDVRTTVCTIVGIVMEI